MASLARGIPALSYPLLAHVLGAAFCVAVAETPPLVIVLQLLIGHKHRLQHPGFGPFVGHDGGQRELLLALVFRDGGGLKRLEEGRDLETREMP